MGATVWLIVLYRKGHAAERKSQLQGPAVMLKHRKCHIKQSFFNSHIHQVFISQLAMSLDLPWKQEDITKTHELYLPLEHCLHQLPPLLRTEHGSSKDMCSGPQAAFKQWNIECQLTSFSGCEVHSGQCRMQKLLVLGAPQGFLERESRGR